MIMFFQKNEEANVMNNRNKSFIKGFKVFPILALSGLIFGCASSGVKEEGFMEDFGYICPPQGLIEELDINERKILTLNGSNCVKVKMDKDATDNYYIREWEKDRLPPMPDL